MKKNYGSDSKSALEAKFEAQKIAFGPIMFQATLALRDLGILDAVSESGSAGILPEEAAQKLKLSEYGVKVLLDAGLSIGVVRMENERYILTKTGFFLLKDSLTRVNLDFVRDVCYNPISHLKESILEGKPAGLKEFGNWPTIYRALAELPGKTRESWFNFDHYYSDQVFPDLHPIIFRNKPGKLMDVGGNTGKFAISCAAYDPDVEITIVDLPGQLKEAMKNAAEAGYKTRIKGVFSDMLEKESSLPAGFDIIWMSQFLDCFSEEQILNILDKARNAMQGHSRLYILETYWDRQKYEASTYSLNATSLYFTCLANGNSRMYHSEDMIRLIKESGLVTEEIIDNLGVSHTLIICKKS